MGMWGWLRAAREAPPSEHEHRDEPDELALTDLAELPVDEDIPPDGDDRKAARKDESEEKVAAAASAERPPRPRRRKRRPKRTVIELPRELHFGMRGLDVTALQRALRHAGFLKRRSTGFYGVATRRAVKAFQRKHGLAADGEYGAATHRVMVRWHHFDKYGESLLARQPVGPTKAEVKRRTARATAILVYNHRAAIHYTMGPLRMQGVRQHIHPPDYPVWEDCSSMDTWINYVAGAVDPNGFGYNGLGFTGTMIRHGVEVSIGEAKVADLVFYGRARNAISHVAIYVGNSMVVSHGSEGGPYYLPWNYRSDMRMVRRYISD